MEAIELRDRGDPAGYVHPGLVVVELEGEARLGEPEFDFLGMPCRECREQVLELPVFSAVEHARVLLTIAILGGQLPGQAGGDRLLQQWGFVRVVQGADDELKAFQFPVAFACAAARRLPTASLSV